MKRARDFRFREAQSSSGKSRSEHRVPATPGLQQQHLPPPQRCCPQALRSSQALAPSPSRILLCICMCLVVVVEDPKTVALADELAGFIGLPIEVVTSTPSAVCRAFAGIYGEPLPVGADVAERAVVVALRAGKDV